MKTFPAVRIEGGLFAPDLLEQLLAGELPGQRPRDFALEGRRGLTEEIAAVFADAQALWGVFQHRLERLPESDPGTTVTRDGWVIPFFGLLGYELHYNRKAYEIGGLTYAVSHRAGLPDYAPPVHIVGVRQDLGRLAPSGRPRLAPHSLVQEFLNRTEALWGLVTNGKVIRLLRNSTYVRRQCYVEFDLEAIFGQHLFQDFVALYRLLHRSRLPTFASDAHQCLLEQYYQHSVEQGGRVRDRLRDGVEECIKRLGNGFLRHPKNDDLRRRVETATATDNPERLTAEELYRQLLRLVYRFLFLFVCEDRGLISRNPLYLEHYGVGRLRRLVDNRAARTEHDDLWHSMRVLWKLFADDTPVQQIGGKPLATLLNLCVLDGELFDPIDLDRYLVSNRDLLDALWHLINYQDSPSSSPRRVNYAALDVEELGSVYESLLEYHPRIDPSGREPRFELIFGSERKSTGSYYTPAELVAELIRSALEPVIEDRLNGANTREEKERALLSIKVLDPACGSGHFLLAAARRLGQELARIRTGEDEPSPERVREAVREVVSHCIYGVDKNPLAVELCRVALWIEAHTPGKPLTFLDHRIRCGDSLVGVFDLEVLKKGISDGAFTPLSGDDDRKLASSLKKQNKRERAGLQTLFAAFDGAAQVNNLGAEAQAVDRIADDSPEAIHQKKQHYNALRRKAEHDLIACNLWTAAFFQPKNAAMTPVALITTDTLFRYMESRVAHPQAVAVAAALSHKYRFFHWPLEFPEVFAEGGFDVVLGNPPYGAIFTEREKKFIRLQHQSVAAAKNAAAYFLALARHIIHSKGRVGFVVPKSFTFSHGWSSTRELILPQILRVIDVGRAWNDVLLEQILLTLTAHSRDAEGIELGCSRKGVPIVVRHADRTIFRQLGIIPTGMSEEDHLLLTAMQKKTTASLGEFLKTRRGTAVQRFAKPKGDLPVLLGRDITEFGKLSLRRFINFSDVPRGKLVLTEPGQVVFQNIVAHIAKPRDHIRLIGTVVEKKFACADTVNLLYNTHSSLSSHVLAGYLMSNLVNWFVYVCIYNRAVRTMHFDGYVLSKIPLPSLDRLLELEVIAQALLKSPKCKECWERMNEVVYEAFDIPPTLRGYVDDMHKARGDQDNKNK